MSETTNVVFKTGNMFTTEQPAFGHGVNCKGMMGSGIAKIIRHDHPEIFAPYKEACNNKTLKAGGMLPLTMDDGTVIFNLASQHFPGANAKYTFVSKSVEATFEYCVQNSFSGFALPRIASDIGGLEWKNVVEIIKVLAAKYPSVTVELWSLPDAK